VSKAGLLFLKEGEKEEERLHLGERLFVVSYHNFESGVFGEPVNSVRGINKKKAHRASQGCTCGGTLVQILGEKIDLSARCSFVLHPGKKDNTLVY